MTYYGLISSIALFVAIGTSYGMGSILTFRYEAYGAYLIASFAPSQLSIIASVPAAYAVSITASLLEILRVKRAGIEGALREF